MKVETTRFGWVEIREDEIITFSKGLLGFQEYKKFVLLPTRDNSPLFWLQSVQEPDLAFVVTEPWVFVEGYSFHLPEKNKKELKIAVDDNIRILCIAVVPEKIEDMTLNLKGPLIINIQKRLGQQVVIAQEYSARHSAFKEVEAPV